MEPNTPTGENAKTDGLMLCLVAAGGCLSELTMSGYIAFVTAAGGTLYMINQIITIARRLKDKHHGGDETTRKD